MGDQYNSARYGTRQALSGTFHTNVTATNAVAVVKFTTAVVVEEVRVGVVLAGTSNATHALSVYKGTGSIGAVAVGTNTAGAIVDASLTDTTFASTDILSLKTTNSDATCYGNFMIFYREQYDSAA